MPTALIDHARQLVKQAESSVRGLIAEAAEVGDYDSLEEIAGIAKELQKIAMNSNAQTSREKIPISTDATSYPRFSRSGGNKKLRMVGWSKKKGAEYKHGAPKAVLDLVVEALEPTCPESGGEPLPMGELLQSVAHPATGREFPEYYTRTCLRWLGGLGLVKKHGHSGYAFTSKAGDDPGPIVEGHWKRLPVEG